MRPFVIVTVNSDCCEHSFDIEIPTEIPCRKVYQDIIDTLSAYNGTQFASGYGGIYSVRLQRYLTPDENLGSAGIWNGDSILLT